MSIPTVQTIRDQIIGYIQSRLGQTVPLFPRSFIYVLASAVAGVLALAYRFAQWCLDQTQPATCNEFWLGIWAGRYNVPRANAVAAVLTLTATGSPDGTSIPAGTQWVTSAGLVYQQNAAVPIAGGSATVTVTCLTPGASGNQANGTTLTLVSPIAGITNTATVASTVTQGVDQESVASWRSQVMNRIAYRPQGGAVPDYVIWALEVPDVAAAFIGQPGGGTVNVYPLAALTGISRLPSGALVSAVDAYIEDPIRKPIGANVVTLTATERSCAVTITSATIGGAVLTAGQKSSIEAAITTALYAAYPKQYPDQPNPTDTIDVGLVWDALRAYGATATGVTINISGIGGGPYTLPIGEIVKPGVYTWA